MNALDWPVLLEKLVDLATSEAGREHLRFLKPLASKVEAEESFAASNEARRILVYGERPFAQSLDLYGGWFQRISRDAILQPLELRDARRFLFEVLSLREILPRGEGPWSKGILEKLFDPAASLGAIDAILSPNGEIRPDASPRLTSLFREKEQQTRSLHQTLDRLVKAHDMEPIVQDRFVTTRDGRWVIPIKSGMQHAVNGVIHGSSQSKQTVFIEPEAVVILNNRLREIEVSIEEEIERLLKELSRKLARHVPDFVRARTALLEADVRFAQAKFAQVLDAHPPRFSSDRLHLVNLQNPFLRLELPEVIPNTIDLDPTKRVLILSGPNAGGKTVLMKSIGLAAHMARCGLMICADPGSHLPFYQRIDVAVGDAQDIGAHLSTFAGHVRKLQEACVGRGPFSLVLVDEICGATDPEEGVALARSFIESYAKGGVFAVITSHFGGLKGGWPEGLGVVSGSLDFDSIHGRPTYQFLRGIPGQSLALATARRVGVDAAIVDRAVELLSPEARARAQVVAEVEQMRDEVQSLRRELMSEVQAMREQKSRYHELVQLFRRERDTWLGRLAKKLEKKVDDLIQSAQAESIFRKHERLHAIKNELPEIIKPKGNSAAVANSHKLDTAEDFEKYFPPGSRVFVPSIQAEGLVQGKVSPKGEVVVLANSMRLSVPWNQLRAGHAQANPTAQIVRRVAAKFHGSAIGAGDTDRTVDVRGKSVDEAIQSLEVQLDTATLANEDRVKIIHGHGTEALKSAIRAHLSRSAYVSQWKAGTSESGGDGVTWVTLRE